MFSVRSSYITVDLDKLRANYTHLKRIAYPARVHAVIKANAYGHGLVPVARALESHGADGLCVALVEEGLELRAAGISLPIWVLNGIYGTYHREVIRAHLTPIIWDTADALAFNAAAEGTLAVHVKIDTGTARLGVPRQEFASFLDGLDSCQNLQIAGAMTHLASADTDPDMTHVQLSRFDQALAQLQAHGHRPTFIHAANSAATLGYAHARYSAVRNGITVYGIGPDLQPALSLTTHILAVRQLPKGEPVGYRNAYHTKRDSRLATIALGYGDGFPRSLTNRGTVLVGGVRCPVVGEISMDLTIVDITDVPQAHPGDEAVLIGTQSHAALPAQQVAQAAEMSVYELFTRLMPRVPRVYIGGSCV
ncbi:MAG: alanine racemase [Myxococcales bacterium]|nr:alanine racemase [Myxococcales bacterium]